MYRPSPSMIRKYADVLVNFALNSGRGMKRNDVVYVVTQQPGLPLAKEIYRTVLQGEGHPILHILDDDLKRLHIETGTDPQLTFFPHRYYRGLADTIDHWVRVLADKDPLFLKGLDPRKIIRYQRSTRPFREWLDDKEDRGKFTWTLCLYGTEGVAREAGMSEREYWNQIRRACFLNEKDPIAQWKNVTAQMMRILTKINRLPIERLHVKARGTDLWLALGENRRWLGGSGRNIPSFEIFTSPDWRGTEGEIAFDLPLYRCGNIIKDIRLRFRKGKIVWAAAAKNQNLLHEIIRQKNADKIGEFSLTDRRFSRITRFMADSLYDENFGGRYGNTHCAIGKAYRDAYGGDVRKMSKKEFARLGFNDSPEHTDIIATTERTVTAVLRDGSERIIYRRGEFVL